MADRAEFHLFGRFEASLAGEPVVLGGPRQQAVLAVLLLARGKPISSERLLDLVWEGAPPASASSTLHAYIARLRKALHEAGQALRTTSVGYVMDVEVDQVDVWSFESAVERSARLDTAADPEAVIAALGPAADLWRGPLLAGGLSDQQWVVGHAARLVDRRLQMVEQLAEANLALGRPADVVRLLADATALDPRREHVVALSMLALYQCGRQADALMAYERCRAALAEDLGIDPSAELREMHLAVLEQSRHLERRPELGRSSAHVLPVRDNRFIGRAETLERLRRELDEHRVVVCTGLNGAGKSSVALELAHRHDGFAGWITADNDGALSAAVVELARTCSVAEPGSEPELLRALWGDIATRTDPLIVFDNAPTLEAIGPYLPPLDQVRVLVTSVNAAWAALGRTVPMGVFDEDESRSILQTRTGSEDVQAVDELAEELGRLPLALSQAAAFIDKSAIDVRQYLDLFARRREELMLRGVGANQANAIGTMWELSFARLDLEAPEAAALLDVMAFFAPYSIPIDVMEALYSRPDPDLEIADAVAQLRRYSLVERDGTTFRLHRLVQAAVRARMGWHRRRDRMDSAARLLVAADPGDRAGPGSDLRWAQLVPHVSALGPLLADSGVETTGFIELSRRCVRYLRMRASFPAALRISTTSVRLAELSATDQGLLGELHSEHGDLHDAAGDLVRARDEHVTALDLLERHLGVDDPRVARAQSRLAHAINCAGDPEAAIELHLRALQVLRARAGNDDVARALVDLGYAQWAAGHTDAARATFTQAIERLADDHVLQAEAVGGLGMVLQDQGDLDGAVRLHRRACAVFRSIHGDVNHPDIAQSLDKLGFALRLIGDTVASVNAHRESERMLVATLGPTDPRVAMSITNCGLALLDLGDREGALACQRFALDAFVAAYGPDHPHSRMAAGRLEALDAGDQPLGVSS